MHVLRNSGEQGRHIRKVIGQAFALPHLSGKVHQQPIGTAPPDFDTQCKRAIGIQRQRNRRLANAPAHGGMANHQAIVFEPGGNEPNGLGA